MIFFDDQNAKLKEQDHMSIKLHRPVPENDVGKTQGSTKYSNKTYILNFIDKLNDVTATAKDLMKGEPAQWRYQSKENGRPTSDGK